jgi:hypothetical protein
MSNAFPLLYVDVVEMSAERRDNGLGLGGVITAHGGEDGTVMG